jgi:hypothetical protein
MPAPVNPWATGNRGYSPQQFQPPNTFQHQQYIQPEPQQVQQQIFLQQPEPQPIQQHAFPQQQEHQHPQQQAFQQQILPPQDIMQGHITNPGAWEDGYDYQDQDQGVYQDQQGPQQSQLSPTDLSTIRSLFPNLKDLSDSFISSTPMDTLLQMNQQAQQAP